MYTVTLEGRGDFAEWRQAARTWLAAGIPPESLVWRVRDRDGSLFGFEEEALPPDAGLSVTVPADFMPMAEAVICHSDPLRFSLLYRMLWRLREERSLLKISSDTDVLHARKLQKSVRRDCHKMTAFVRFKEVTEGEPTGRRRFAAWFEPDHFIVERTASFFQRRFTDMDWLIATPKGRATWDGTALVSSSEPAEKPELTDEADDLWRTYYANIFNPARLKIKAMTAEMPKKYWKNLPEASLIPDLIANAEAHVLAMARKAATEPLPFHHRLQEAAAKQAPLVAENAGTLEGLREEASKCTLCPLHCMATQTVFGEGVTDAATMFVGEQPGDQEDLTGLPFVGPAGKVFNQVLGDVGIDRSSLYVTNAVKHFKYELRGKKRIHQRPDAGEVQRCRWWLTQELDLVKPKLVVAMGATALFSLTGMQEKLSAVRGRPMPMTDGRALFVTVHPSYLLRIPDEGKRAEEMVRFKQDMADIRKLAAMV